MYQRHQTPVVLLFNRPAHTRASFLRTGISWLARQNYYARRRPQMLKHEVQQIDPDKETHMHQSKMDRSEDW
jgi:hypothetical protein